MVGALHEGEAWLELHTIDGRLKPGDAFKMIATGYLWGAGALFVPAITLMTIIIFLSGAPIETNGGIVEGSQRLKVLAPVILAPIIVAGQAVMIGGLVVFGLWLYEKRRPIRVINHGGDA